MPVFNFKCTKCGKEEDRLCKASESDTLLKCSGCGEVTSQKVFSAPTSAPILKGTGFYQTDFKGK